jgi:hypothetical protein
MQERKVMGQNDPPQTERRLSSMRARANFSAKQIALSVLRFYKGVKLETRVKVGLRLGYKTRKRVQLAMAYSRMQRTAYYHGRWRA